jgi:toxin HigB-1
LIKSFAGSETHRFWISGRSRRIPADLAQRAMTKLQLIDAATDLGFLKLPPGNKLEALRGDRKGQHSIRINQQWRICFRCTGNDAEDVEITDYH